MPNDFIPVGDSGFIPVPAPGSTNHLGAQMPMGLPVAPQMSPLNMQYAGGGFTPSNMLQNAISAAKGTYQFGKDALDPRVNLTEGPSSLLSKYVINPAQQQFQTGQQLQQAGQPDAAKEQKFLAQNVPMLGPLIGSLDEQMREKNYGGAAAQAGTMAAMGKGAGMVGDAGRVLTGEKSFGETSPGRATQEIMGAGQSMKNLKSFLHDSATRKIQPYVQQVEQGVHADASQAMSSVLGKIDAAHPEGVFPKDLIRAQVKEAMGDIVKVPEKVPVSVSKILNDPGAVEGKTGFGKSTGPAIGGRHFNLNDANDLKAWNNMKAQGVFSPEEIVRTEGTTGTPNWSAEQLKQLRSDLGREMMSTKGPTNAAAQKVYGILSQQLRGAAKDNGVESQWLDANSKWKDYMNDFVKSPMKKVLTGQNATDITAPLTGKDSEVTSRILDKYQQFAPADKTAFDAELKKHVIGATSQRWSRPSRIDLILGAISPKALAIRQGIPRVMRSPGVIEAISGKGLPDIPTKKVLPNPPKE